MCKKRDISFSILENALNFIATALQNLGKDAKDIDDNDIKYGIIHLWSGLELLLKARLQSEHWTLIIKDLNRGSVESYLNGDFVSVTFEESLKRLERYCGTEIEADKIKSLNELRVKRNKIVHFEFHDNKTALIPLVADVVWFAINFAEKELADDMAAKDILWLIGSLKEDIARFDHFVFSRMEEISSKLKDAHAVWTCPECGQNALCLGGHSPECLFCGYTELAGRVVRAYIHKVLNVSYFDVAEGYYDPVYRCAFCNDVTVVPTKEMNPESYMCISCGEENVPGNFGTCSRCHTPIVMDEDDELELCGDCIQYMVLKAD